MAKIEPLPREKAYAAINGWMYSNYGEPIDPYSFYRLLFPEGALETQEERDERKKGRYGAIALQIWRGEEVKTERHTLTDDLDALGEIITSDAFCVLSPISYVGKSAKGVNARNLYALAIDVDNIVGEGGYPRGLDQLVWQTDARCASHAQIPKPTAIVSSGSGIHIYWMFDKPLRLFPKTVKQLKKLRHELTDRLWKYGISADYDRNKIQYEGVFQGLRMVGSLSKQGRRVLAWHIGDKLSVEQINEYVDAECRVDPIAVERYRSTCTLAEAKEKWPDWHERRIIKGEKKKTWTCSRKVYEWWLRKAAAADVGHRYYTMMCLAVYAVKCGVPIDDLERDMRDLAEILDQISPPDGSNNIEEADIKDALEAYSETYKTYPINSIAYRSGLEIQKNKRNGRPQETHLKIMRAIQETLDPAGKWRNKNGQPKKREIVKKWRAENPAGRKIDCQRETGLSRPTVLKWWDD